jgi:putative ABC transport system ATP-binding protein
MSEALIQASGLVKLYKLGGGIVRALDGVSLTIEAGEYVAIMGPSGSGKSTLMNVLGGLDRPTEGSYRLQGEEVGSLSSDRLARFRNRNIGFVFQSFNLLPRLSALQNVALPMIYGGLPPKARKARAVELLQAVGLGERLANRPTQLSGGQQQRVAIARSLANEPNLLLADEPTGALDERTGEEVMDLFESLNREGKTIVIVTHDAEVAARAARTVRMRDGHIVEDVRRGR